MLTVNARYSGSRKFLQLLLGFALLFFTGCGDRQEGQPATGVHQQAAMPAATVYEGKIIVLGDSLAAGLGVAYDEAFPALLQDKLRQDGFNWQVINGGISGETSSGALSRTNWIIAQKPDIVILETGANDGFRGIPPQVIQNNITRSVRLLKEAGIEVVLAGMQMLQNLGPLYTAQFAAVYPAVAEEENVILIPFLLDGVAAVPSLNLEDTIHPNPAGHRIVAETVYPYVVEAIENSNRNE